MYITIQVYPPRHLRWERHCIAAVKERRWSERRKGERSCFIRGQKSLRNCFCRSSRPIPGRRSRRCCRWRARWRCWTRSNSPRLLTITRLGVEYFQKSAHEQQWGLFRACGIRVGGKCTWTWTLDLQGPWKTTCPNRNVIPEGTRKVGAAASLHTAFQVSVSAWGSNRRVKLSLFVPVNWDNYRRISTVYYTWVSSVLPSPLAPWSTTLYVAAVTPPMVQETRTESVRTLMSPCKRRRR